MCEEVETKNQSAKYSPLDDKETEAYSKVRDMYRLYQARELNLALKKYLDNKIGLLEQSDNGTLKYNHKIILYVRKLLEENLNTSQIFKEKLALKLNCEQNYVFQKTFDEKLSLDEISDLMHCCKRKVSTRKEEIKEVIKDLDLDFYSSTKFQKKDMQYFPLQCKEYINITKSPEASIEEKEAILNEIKESIAALNILDPEYGPIAGLTYTKCIGQNKLLAILGIDNGRAYTRIENMIYRSEVAFNKRIKTGGNKLL